MIWRRQKLQQTTLVVEGIRCNHCETSIKFSPSKIPGVKRVRIHKRRQMMIEFDPDELVSHQLLVIAIQKTGYQIEKISDID
jgi:cation transport ATPase